MINNIWIEKLILILIMFLVALLLNKIDSKLVILCVLVPLFHDLYKKEEKKRKN